MDNQKAFLELLKKNPEYNDLVREIGALLVPYGTGLETGQECLVKITLAMKRFNDEQAKKVKIFRV